MVFVDFRKHEFGHVLGIIVHPARHQVNHGGETVNYNRY
jgi:hypothetical protein